VNFNGIDFKLNANSVQILNSTFDVIYDTAKLPDPGPPLPDPQPIPLGPWRYFSEKVGVSMSFPVINSSVPIDQLRLTKDSTDYACVTVNLSSSIPSPVMSITSTQASGFQVFVDGVRGGQYYNLETGGAARIFNVTMSGTAVAGTHQIDVFSVAIGNMNVGQNLETLQKGIVGSVMLSSGQNLTNGNLWTMQAGVSGDLLQVYTSKGVNNVVWSDSQVASKPQWARTSFISPPFSATTVLALDLAGATKGHAYVNGNDLGRYWLLNGKCLDDFKCYSFDRDSCDKPTQSLYHVPTDWLVPRGGENLVVIFDEFGEIDVDTVQLLIVRP